MDPVIEQRLAELLAGKHSQTGDPLDAGAQLVVTDPDGSEAFRAALARHYRPDTTDPALVWIRPITGGGPATGPGGGYTFNLSLARRRSLSITQAQLTGEWDILLELASGQTARIGPATGGELDDLRRWDDFTLRLLTAEEEAALESLDGDSWYGRFG